MKNAIEVRIEQHYGRITIYPVCETAKLFAQIAKTKTLTSDAIRHIKDLGYQVRVETPDLEEALNG